MSSLVSTLGLSRFPALLSVLNEFSDLLNESDLESKGFSDEKEFWHAMECAFSVRHLAVKSRESLGKKMIDPWQQEKEYVDTGDSVASLPSTTKGEKGVEKSFPIGEEILVARVALLESLSEALDEVVARRVAVSSTSTTSTSTATSSSSSSPIPPMEPAPATSSSAHGAYTPRLIRLSSRYGFAEEPHLVKAMAILCLRQSYVTHYMRSVFVSNGFNDGEAACVSRAVLEELCGMNCAQVETFMEEKQEHVSEGIVVIDEQYDGNKLPRLCKEAVIVLSGIGELKADDRLKLSSTAVLEVLEEEEGGGSATAKGSAATGSSSDETFDVELRAIADDAEGEAGMAAATARMEVDEGDDDGGDGEDKGYTDEQPTSSPLTLIKTLTADAAKTVKAMSDAAERAAKEKEEQEKEKSASELKRPAPLLPLSASASPLDGCMGMGMGVGTPLGEDGDRAALTLDGEHRAYESSLAYLSDKFQEMVQRIRISLSQRETMLRDIGAKDESATFYGERKGKKKNIKEIQMRLKLAQARIAARLEAGAAAGAAPPRLEALSANLGLDAFEKNVIVLLIGHTISPLVKAVLKETNGQSGYYSGERGSTLTVKSILEIFCRGFEDQVRKRTAFYKSSRLFSRGIVKVARSYAGLPRQDGGDLVDQSVYLDRRMLDWIVGLDTEINELVEGSNLYTPKVTLDDVVLPERQMRQILRSVQNFDRFRAYCQKSGLKDYFFASGLTLLFHGPSGVGKTLMVNAIAATLGKRVLLVNFDMLATTYGGGNSQRGADLQGLFREAEMNGSVLFFDECESIFASRQSGSGSGLLTSLLTELERYQGLSFLATNRPFDLDEAMHRRINAVFEFSSPDYKQRRQIWQIHTSHPAIVCEKDINWDEIAERYNLSGGFIKNAVQAALLRAVSRCKTGPAGVAGAGAAAGAGGAGAPATDPACPIITQDDIVAGCQQQMRASLRMSRMSNRVVPSFGIDTLVLRAPVRTALEAAVRFEKARSVLFGQWGFGSSGRGGEDSDDESSSANEGGNGDGQGKNARSAATVRRPRHGPRAAKCTPRLATTLLFWGSPGTGKSSAAEAIGFEIGKPLKVLSVPELLAGIANNSSKGKSKSLRALFDDAALLSAVIVLDRFDPELFSADESGGVGGSGAGGASGGSVSLSTLLDLIERYRGVVILITTSRRKLSAVRHRLHPDFVNAIKFFVEFARPGPASRKNLWPRMIPPRLPLAGALRRPETECEGKEKENKIEEVVEESSIIRMEDVGEDEDEGAGAGEGESEEETKKTKKKKAAQSKGKKKKKKTKKIPRSTREAAFAKLGEDFDLTGGEIADCVYRAAAAAALRQGASAAVSEEDLRRAAEEEVQRKKGGDMATLMGRLFV